MNESGALETPGLADGYPTTAGRKANDHRTPDPRHSPVRHASVHRGGVRGPHPGARPGGADLPPRDLLGSRVRGCRRLPRGRRGRVQPSPGTALAVVRRAHRSFLRGDPERVPAMSTGHVPDIAARLAAMDAAEAEAREVAAEDPGGS